MTDPAEVAHDPAAGRFSLEVAGRTAELTYRRSGERMVLLHTGVPVDLRHRGLAGQLMQAVVDTAATEGTTLVPRCSYTRHWLAEHPDQAARVAVRWD